MRELQVHVSRALQLFLLLILINAPAAAQVPATSCSRDFHTWAPTPPMGWNSWDCYGPEVNERQILANADYIARSLKSHGWDTVVIDGRWCRADPAQAKSSGGMDLEMDASGRLLPAPNRFPSSRDTRSFKPLADMIHARGLKFGLHLLRGIPRLAVKRNTPILATNLHATDIADTSSTCRWSDDTYGIDPSKPGAQEYYDSVFALLASWEIDFIKVDDLARPYPKGDVEAIRKAIDKTGRAIVFSISPGPLPAEQAAHIAAHANLWRISGDFWDTWPKLYAQFANLSEWSAHRGRGFPDADMLPIGTLRLWQPKASHLTRFTRDEQITLLTLWSIARSPLFVGGNLPDNDEFTLSLLTNDEVIAVNQHSLENRQVLRGENQVVWMAKASDSNDLYFALFNTAPPGPASATQPAVVVVQLSELGVKGPCQVRDLWMQRDLGLVPESISATLPPHGAALYRLRSGNP